MHHLIQSLQPRSEISVFTLPLHKEKLKLLQLTCLTPRHRAPKWGAGCRLHSVRTRTQARLSTRTLHWSHVVSKGAWRNPEKSAFNWGKRKGEEICHAKWILKLKGFIPVLPLGSSGIKALSFKIHLAWNNLSCQMNLKTRRRQHREWTWGHGEGEG